MTEPPLEPLSKTSPDTLLSVACARGQISVIHYLVKVKGCDAFGELHMCRNYIIVYMYVLVVGGEILLHGG